MNISPIDGVSIAPMVRPRETDLGVVDIDRTERTSRTRDETYQPGNSQAATGFEDENDAYDDLGEDNLDEYNEDSEAERKVQPAVKGKIDYFA